MLIYRSRSIRKLREGLKIKKYLVWLIILVTSQITSIFIHEVGHGLSAYIQGVKVSTGFNKVGDINKKPSDINFRSEIKQKEIKWDLGVPITLALAIIFSILLYTTKTDNIYIISTIAGFAISNSLLRLIPMINSLSGLIIMGELRMEDEVGIGLLWYKVTGKIILKYIPILISLIISIVCYSFTLRGIRCNAPYLLNSTIGFSIVIVISLLISFKIANVLDEVIRINWG